MNNQKMESAMKASKHWLLAGISGGVALAASSLADRVASARSVVKEIRRTLGTNRPQISPLLNEGTKLPFTTEICYENKTLGHPGADFILHPSSFILGLRLPPGHGVQLPGPTRRRGEARPGHLTTSASPFTTPTAAAAPSPSRSPTPPSLSATACSPSCWISGTPSTATPAGWRLACGSPTQR